MPVEVVLLERVEKLGQMGQVVKVRPGFARNFLLPQKKALRATKENLTYFEQQRTQLEAQNLQRRGDAEQVAKKLDGIAVVQSVQQDGFSRVITLALPEDLARHTVLKGSIALDGVSLTISALEDSSLSVSLIPETLVRTTLGAAQPGDCVNVEVDVLAKHVERLLASTLKV